jgi:putative GTP pyrophosphokinase
LGWQDPSHGYRAVHVIAHLSGKLVEIQVRSALQHLWAELSERLSDVVDASIKYGGGPAQQRQILDQSSRQLAAAEALEAGLATP